MLISGGKVPVLNMFMTLHFLLFSFLAHPFSRGLWKGTGECEEGRVVLSFLSFSFFFSYLEKREGTELW